MHFRHIPKVQRFSPCHGGIHRGTWEQQEVQRHAPHRAARLGTVLGAGGAAAAEARLGAQRLGPRAPGTEGGRSPRRTSG